MSGGVEDTNEVNYDKVKYFLTEVIIIIILMKEKKTTGHKWNTIQTVHTHTHTHAHTTSDYTHTYTCIMGYKRLMET